MSERKAGEIKSFLLRLVIGRMLRSGEDVFPSVKGQGNFRFNDLLTQSDLLTLCLLSLSHDSRSGLSADIAW